jgi:hypothetical protein
MIISDFDVELSDEDEALNQAMQLGPKEVIHRDPFINPFWIENKSLGTGPIGKT